MKKLLSIPRWKSAEKEVNINDWAQDMNGFRISDFFPSVLARYYDCNACGSKNHRESISHKI